METLLKLIIFMYMPFAVYSSKFTACVPFMVNTIYSGKFTVWFTAGFTHENWKKKNCRRIEMDIFGDATRLAKKKQ